MIDHSYTSFDVFAGAGGFTLGLEEAGFRCLGAIEVDPVASSTLSEAGYVVRWTLLNAAWYGVPQLRERMKPGDRYPEAIQIAEERYREALASFRTSGENRCLGQSSDV